MDLEKFIDISLPVIREFTFKNHYKKNNAKFTSVTLSNNPMYIMSIKIYREDNHAKHKNSSGKMV